MVIKGLREAWFVSADSREVSSSERRIGRGVMS